MKQSSLMQTISRIALSGLFLGVITGCTEKSLYDENWRKSQLPPEDSFFDFNMRADIPLNINYGIAGFQTFIEIYDQNPLVEGTNLKKEQVEPIYKAFTDKDGKLSVSMYIPTAVKEAYLYTKRLGLPLCVKMNATAAGFEYDATKTPSRATRAKLDYVLNDAVPYEAESPNAANGQSGKRVDNLYSLTAWDANGRAVTTNYITSLDKLGAESMATLTKRVGDYLNTYNNSKPVGNKDFLQDPEKLNIKIPQGDGAEIKVTFVGEQAAYLNTFGYYYYPSSNQGFTGEEFYKGKKYVLFPNVSIEQQISKCGDTVNLLYFDDKGNASTKFPGGYTIGWFLISDGFNSKFYSRIRTIDGLSFSIPEYPRTTCCSNEKGDKRQFITVYDEKSKLYVVGIEDQLGKGQADDYMDLMFFVQTTPEIDASDRPSIPDTPEAEPESQTETVSGVLSFEDIWPSGGDYDLNDVVVKYERTITFGPDAEGKNYATQIVETFTPIWSGASYENAFAYQTSYLGKVEQSGEFIVENETGSIILASNVKGILNKSTSITRNFDKGAVTKDQLIKDFNPYIIVHGYSKENRTEVHLPKKSCTIFANKDLNYTGNDAYFVDKSGVYPFAIDIPYVDYIVPTVEKLRIDDENVYPDFKKWVESRNTTNQDWYLNYKGNK